MSNGKAQRIRKKPITRRDRALFMAENRAKRIRKAQAATELRLSTAFTGLQKRPPDDECERFQVQPEPPRLPPDMSPGPSGILVVRPIHGRVEKRPARRFNVFQSTAIFILAIGLLMLVVA